VYVFYYELPNNIRILKVEEKELVEKRNDLSPTKMYEMIEKANQELEVRYESQQAYNSSHRFPRYESGASRNRLRGEWRNQRNNRSRQDSREQFNDKQNNSESKDENIPEESNFDQIE